ncbi:methyl farnesoate epoxidase-like [Pollicipes pollicipes]|uniref:methyl farnesoate epoxidase-like n=1 Tax=Pollicipes pollicipes TaxID=41117 RepID=UPI001884DB32|nr:methyl farnesoate epoxidase-like [Pollicipes pollicipes]
MLSWPLLLLLAAALGWLWARRPRRPSGFPPGPPTFLIFGDIRTTLELLFGDVREVLLDRRRRYGDINGVVSPGGQFIVNICAFEDIKEACSMPELSGRPETFSFLVRSFMQKLGIIFNDGVVWQEGRRFALRHLKDLGLGRSSMEDSILAEFEHLHAEMERDVGKPMLVNNRFNLTVLNVLWKMVASERLDPADPQSMEHVRLVNDSIAELGPRNLLMIAPWLRHVAPGLSGYNALVQQRDAALAMFQRLVRQHRATLDPRDPRDYIDRFLLEMETGDAAERGFNELNLVVIGMDFLLAGMETTSTSLSWALLFMVKHPEVQRRVQREVDAVLGGRAPAGADRLALPYTDAVLMEVTRRAAVVPRAVPHAATRDVRFRGYLIPRGAVVMMSLHDVHMDAAYWGDPERFRPERFLDESGAARRDPRLMPFGVGRRSCLGEQLARAELFLLFVCLMQRFSFEAVPGEALPSDGQYAALLQPEPFHVTYRTRAESSNSST